MSAAVQFNMMGEHRLYHFLTGAGPAAGGGHSYEAGVHVQLLRQRRALLAAYCSGRAAGGRRRCR